MSKHICMQRLKHNQSLSMLSMITQTKRYTCHQPSDHTIVFIPGLLQNFKESESFINGFLPVFNVIVVEPAGWPKGAVVDYSVSFEDIGKAVADRLINDGLSSCYVIGLSYGSIIAGFAANYLGSRVKKVILSGAGEFCGQRKQRIQRLLDHIKKGERQHIGPQLSQLLVNQQAGISKADKIAKGLGIVCKRSNHLTLECLYHNLKRTQAMTAATFARLCVPSLWLTGQWDHFTVPEQVEYTSSFSQQAHFICIKDADHFYHIEQASSVVSLFSDYFLYGYQTAIDQHPQTVITEDNLATAC